LVNVPVMNSSTTAKIKRQKPLWDKRKITLDQIPISITISGALMNVQLSGITELRNHVGLTWLTRSIISRAIRLRNTSFLAEGLKLGI
jgi:hypothetical protein